MEESRAWSFSHFSNRREVVESTLLAKKITSELVANLKMDFPKCPETWAPAISPCPLPISHHPASWDPIFVNHFICIYRHYAAFAVAGITVRKHPHGIFLNDVITSLFMNVLTSSWTHLRSTSFKSSCKIRTDSTGHRNRQSHSFMAIS